MLMWVYMIFKQLFDKDSSTFTYLISCGVGRELAIIDPVYNEIPKYLKILSELNIQLVKVIDTHIHADHISGMAQLKKLANCISIMGEQTSCEIVDIKVKENEIIKIDELELRSIYTPGHTNDSYCFSMKDRIFTGDTLLINGTGRTDFQNGSSDEAYDSLFNKVLKQNDEILVYPGHDYNGNKVSTIEKEKKTNPRLQVNSKSEYIEIMENLNLKYPRMIDIAVPANTKGFVDEKLE
ncbi:MBL fold metallo-hydrolase [Pelagibacterales bacterium]|nr:MBL fold metallo-hydrolase [Pelagibacterales bacterium]MDB9955198.1 MBL fold metallo-hydrolase [Pelagibacterales bacterium]